MDGSSSCCCCCSPVRGSHRSPACSYAAGLTSNVEQIPLFKLSLRNFYLFECLYAHGHRLVIVRGASKGDVGVTTPALLARKVILSYSH